jgi:hypothetical protein
MEVLLFANVTLRPACACSSNLLMRSVALRSTSDDGSEDLGLHAGDDEGGVGPPQGGEWAAREVQELGFARSTSMFIIQFTVHPDHEVGFALRTTPCAKRQHAPQCAPQGQEGTPVGHGLRALRSARTL